MTSTAHLVLSNAIVAVAVAVPVPVPVTMSIASVHRGKMFSKPDKGHDVQPGNKGNGPGGRRSAPSLDNAAVRDPVVQEGD